MKKIWLDTDIGNDIDDSIALSYLLSRDDCEVVGVSTVRPGGVGRCALICEIGELWGRDLPVYPGLEAPFAPTPCPAVSDYNPSLDWETDAPTQDSTLHPDPLLLPGSGEHLKAMSRAIKENPGEIILLGIGPFTNIAALFTMYPEISGLLGGLITMSGHFIRDFDSRRVNNEFTEWNVRCDPMAAQVVYSARVPMARHIGVDVTSRVNLPRAEAERLFSGPKCRPIMGYLDAWFSHRQFVTFHDVLAAAVIFEPDLCAYERGRVEIELLSPRMQGFTYWFPDPASATEIATEVDADAFMSHLHERLLGRKSRAESGSSIALFQS